MRMINDFTLNLWTSIDAYFGFLPALAALQENHMNENQNVFDVNRFIVVMRKFMALEEMYCSHKMDEDSHLLEQFTKPDRLLFERAINTNNISGYPDDIFSQLKDDGYFESFERPPKGKRYWKIISKNKDKKPQFLMWLQESLNMEPTANIVYANFTHMNTINNEYEFKKRAEHTINLNQILRTKNILNDAKTKNLDLKENKKLANQYVDLKEIRSLVGIIRPYPGQTIMYIMCHFKTKTEQSLEKTSRELDHFVPFACKCDEDIRLILNECAKMSSPRSNDCHIRKLLARPYDSPRDVCVIFFVTFLNDINSGPQNRIPLQTFRGTAQHYLKGKWEFYMKRTEIYKFALKETEETES